MKVRDRIRDLRRVRAGDLVPNPKNWRKHPESQQNALRGLLAEIGYADALLCRELPDGRLQLLDGHLRAETTPDAEVPVLVVDLTDDEADKLLATLDPLSAMATADAGKLDALLREIQTESEAVAAMLTELAESNGILSGPTEVVEDEVPEPPADPITKPGDLWLLGEHRLLCGDSTKAEDVARVLGDRKPFLMVTDPPYGVEYDGGEANETKRERLAGDSSADMYDPCMALTPVNVAYVWFAGCNALPVYSAVIKHKFTPRALLIWNKLNAHYGAPSAHYKQRHEPCLYSVRNGSAKFVGDMTTPTVWDIEQPHRNEHHPTQKPVECMARPIRNHGGKDDDVYDPFLGSGTTLIAAEQLNRRCYGLEISPAYCDVIVTRWEKLTGKQATLEKPARRKRTKQTA